MTDIENMTQDEIEAEIKKLDDLGVASNKRASHSRKTLQLISVIGGIVGLCFMTYGYSSHSRDIAQMGMILSIVNLMLYIISDYVTIRFYSFLHDCLNTQHPKI